MSLIFKALGVREGREFSASLKSYFKLHFLNPTCIKERTLKDSKSWAGYVRERKGQEQTKGLHFEVQEDISRYSKDWGAGRNARSGRLKANAKDQEAGWR